MFCWQRHGRKIRLPRQRVRKIHHDVRYLSATRRLVASDAGSQSKRTSKHAASFRVGALCQGLDGAIVWGLGDPFGMN